ncbi:MAG TPA: PAS domain S-box protein [Bacteroidales bacterium]|nr:PAS domain S-box protein [Bacteroidales bacterium]
MTEDNLKNEAAKFSGINNSGEETKRSSLCNTVECYRQLITALPGTSLMVFNKNFEILLYEGGKKEFMLKDNQVEGITIYELFPKRMINLLKPVFTRALKGEASSFEHEYLHNAFRRYIIPLSNEEGEIENGLLITIDRSSARRIEKIMTQSLSWYRNIINHFEEGLAIFEKERIIYASPSYHHWFGFEIMKDMTFEQVAEAIHPDDLHYVTSMFNSGDKEQLDSKQYQYRIIRADGSILWLEDHLKYEYSLEGKLLRTIVNTSNISAFRKSETKNDELVKELEFHQQIHDVLGEGIALLDNQQRFVFANPATAQIFETKTGELIYTSLEDYRLEDYTGPGSETSPGPDENMTTHYIVVRTEEGNKKILRYHTFPFFIHSNLFANLAVFRDVTAETGLQRHTSLLEEIITGSGMGYVMLKVKEQDIHISKWITSRLGYQTSDLVKLSPGKLLDKLLQADDAQVFKATLANQSSSDKTIHRSGYATDKQGYKVPCILNLHWRKDTEEKSDEFILTLQEQPEEENNEF